MIQENGRLTKIAGGGFSEEPGSSTNAGAQPAKWEGDVGIYYRETQDRRQVTAGGDVVVRRIIVVPTRAIAGLEIVVDDEVEFTVEGEAQTGKIQAVTIPRLAPLAPSGVETSRLELRPV